MQDFGTKSISLNQDACSDEDGYEVFTLSLASPAEINGDHYVVIDFRNMRGVASWVLVDGITETPIGLSQGFYFTEANETYALKAYITPGTIEEDLAVTLDYSATAIYAPSWANGIGRIVATFTVNAQTCRTTKYLCCDGNCGLSTATFYTLRIIEGITNNPNFWNGTTFTFTQAQYKRESDNNWYNLSTAASILIKGIPNCEIRTGVFYLRETSAVKAIEVRATAVNGTQVTSNGLSSTTKTIVHADSTAEALLPLGVRTVISSAGLSGSYSKNINYGANTPGPNQPCDSPGYSTSGSPTHTKVQLSTPVVTGWYAAMRKALNKTFSGTITVGLSSINISGTLTKTCNSPNITWNTTATLTNPGALPCRIDLPIYSTPQVLTSWTETCGNESYLFELEHYNAQEWYVLGYGGAACYVCTSDTASGGTNVKITGATRGVSTGTVRLFITRTS